MSSTMQGAYQLISQLGTLNELPVNVQINPSNFCGCRFLCPENLDGFIIQFSGFVTGTPTNPVSVTLHGDNGNNLPISTVLETQIVQPTAFSTSTKWIATPTFSSSLVAETMYWIEFKTSENIAIYTIQLNGYPLSPDSLGFSTNSASPNRASYGSVIWVQNTSSETIVLYPLIWFSTNSASLGRTMNQQFTAQSNFSFDTLWLFNSDRSYEIYPAYVYILGPGGTLATAQITTFPDSMRGMGTDEWIPIPFNTTVNCVAGSSYTVQTNVTSSSIVPWGTLGNTTSPASAGFQGNAKCFVFALSLSGAIVEKYFDIGSIHQSDAVSTTQYLGARFFNGAATTLNTVQAKVWSGNGTLVAQIYTDNRAGSDWQSQPLTPVSGAIATTTVSTSGWATLTFSPNVTLNPNTYYWAVFSTSSGSLLLTRLVCPYTFLIHEYQNGIWQNGTAQGPTDLAIRVATAAGEYRMMQDYTANIAVTPNIWVAESFTASANENAAQIGVPVSTDIYNSSYTDLVVALYSDNGGMPGSLLSSGVIPGYLITVGGTGGLYLCDLANTVVLTHGTKYWIVVYGKTAAVNVGIIGYLAGFEGDAFANGNEQALVSTGPNFGWSQIAGRQTNMQFAIFSGSSIQPPPTTGTLTGQVLDNSTGLPLASATVTLVGQTSTTTDSSGDFSFDSITFGTAAISASLTGYQTNQITYMFTPTSAPAIIDLTPNSPPPLIPVTISLTVTQE